MFGPGPRVVNRGPSQRAVGIDVWRSGIGPTILINLVITFSLSFISKGGHVGGLVAGAAVGWILIELPRRVRNRDLPVALCAVLVPTLFLAAIASSYAFGPTI